MTTELQASPQLLLAPMEGLLDHALRETLTRVGGVDRCVSEFIRVTDALLPARCFYRVMPELHHAGYTQAGVPVRGQLLGSDATLLAENAARMAELGSHGVDLNFGCPAPVVNRHGGGAALLQDPELMHRIVYAVRQAVPKHVPVSAKMRLGFHDDSLALDCALAIETAGANEVVVHARTKAQGYRPPAYWGRIADLRSQLRIRMVANGEIWTVADALACQQQSQCVSLMLGRGMVSDPGLAWAIRHAWGHALAPAQTPWPQVLDRLGEFWGRVSLRVEPKHRAGRLKQWLNLLRRRYPQAQQAFDELRLCHHTADIERWLQQQGCAPHAKNLANEELVNEGVEP